MRVLRIHTVRLLHRATGFRVWLSPYSDLPSKPDTDESANWTKRWEDSRRMTWTEAEAYRESMPSCLPMFDGWQREVVELPTDD